MQKLTTSELEQAILREAIPPKNSMESDREHIQEAVEFVQNRLRKAPLKSQVSVALNYLARYGYTSRYTPTRMNGR